MEGQGVLDDFIGLSVPSQQYLNSVFQIGVRNRVAASTEFNEFRAKYPESVRMHDQQLMEEYASLERIKDKEHAMNTRLFEDRQRHPVKFGEVIQLLHVNSGR